MAIHLAIVLEEEPEGPLLQHQGLVRCIISLLQVGGGEKELEDALIDVQAGGGVQLEEERELEPDVFVVCSLVVSLFAQSGWQFDAIGHPALLLSQLEDKHVLIFVFHFVDDVGQGVATSKVDALVDGDKVDDKRLLLDACDFGNAFAPIWKTGFAVAEAYLSGLFLEIALEDEAFEVVSDSLRDRESDCDKWVKGNRLLLASGASNLRFILSSHKVGDDGLIAFDMSKPALTSYFLVGPSTALNGGHIWLLFHSIQVLVDTVDQEGEELLRVMLGVSRKHGIDGADCALYEVWRVDALPIAPHGLDEHGVVSS